MKKIFIYLAAVVLAAFTSCEKNSNSPEIEDPKSSMIKISEAYAIGSAAKAELWSKTELSTGYRKLFIALYDSSSNKPLNKASVQIMPIMDMNMNGKAMSHSSPFENPQSTEAENTLFPCAAVFTMPSSGADGKWHLNVMVKKEGQSKFGKAELPLLVKQSEPERVNIITAADGSRLFISYVAPLNPKIGINDFEITVHYRQDMMTFPADDSYTIVMTPEMPSMGHGSPNNINPVHLQNGHYKGKVNFTMTGNWRIKLDLTKDGKTMSTFFDLLF